MLVALISAMFAVGVFVAGYLMGRGNRTSPPMEYLPENDEELFEKEKRENARKIEEMKHKLEYFAPDDGKEANIEKAAQ